MGPRPPRASPLSSSPIVVKHDSGTLSSRYSIPAAEPVLIGHFPGLAIFPGVCLIECAHLTALAELERTAGDHRLVCIESARFLAPVFPGDEIEADISVREAGPDSWICTATTSVGGNRTGVFRLRYQTERNV